MMPEGDVFDSLLEGQLQSPLEGARYVIPPFEGEIGYPNPYAR
jgi:hypothetical protein